MFQLKRRTSCLTGKKFDHLIIFLELHIVALYELYLIVFYSIQISSLFEHVRYVHVTVNILIFIATVK